MQQEGEKMKHHYIVFAWMKFDAVCRMGAICEEAELARFLVWKDVKRYKMISVDDEVVDNWKDQEWTLL